MPALETGWSSHSDSGTSLHTVWYSWTMRVSHANYRWLDYNRQIEVSYMSCTAADFQDFEKKIASVVDSASSLEGIDAWLKSQKCIKSVQLANYLLKSNPPQRDFIVEFNIENGSTVKKIVNVFDLGNSHFKFHMLRDQ